MKKEDESIVTSVDIFYMCNGINSVKTVKNNDTIQFTTFLDALQRLGGKEFVKTYINDDAIFDGYLITINIGNKYYSF